MFTALFERVWIIGACLLPCGIFFIAFYDSDAFWVHGRFDQKPESYSNVLWTKLKHFLLWMKLSLRVFSCQWFEILSNSGFFWPLLRRGVFVATKQGGSLGPSMILFVTCSNLLKCWRLCLQECGSLARFRFRVENCLLPFLNLTLSQYLAGSTAWELFQRLMGKVQALFVVMPRTRSLVAIGPIILSTLWYSCQVVCMFRPRGARTDLRPAAMMFYLLLMFAIWMLL